MLLSMFAGLMATHLLVMFLNVMECRQYTRILIDQLHKMPENASGISSAPQIREWCQEMKSTFTELASQYISVILALLGGAAGVASLTRKDDNGDK